MNKSLLILFAIFALAACRSPLLPTSAASPSVTTSSTTTENLPAPTLTGDLPYPPPGPTSPSVTPEYPYIPPMPSNAPAPYVTETSQPLDLSGVWFAKLLNDKQGWVLSDGNLLWTDDTGQHWRQMTPPVIGDEYIQRAFFLDSQQAWVLVCDPDPSGGVIKITYTSDGGNTWGMSEVTSMQDILPSSVWQGCSGRNIYFLNAQKGWILVDTTQTMNSHHGEMFQTLDGGQTWQHLDTSPLGDFFFVSDTTGWMSATCCTGGPIQLYRTQDGGKTWEGIGVNGSNQYDDFYLPVFFDQQVGLLAVTLRGPEGTPSDELTFFKTQDGGASWEPTGKLSIAPNSLDIDNLGKVRIWDEQTWVVTLPNVGVYWTLNGGQNWVENTAETARGIFELTLGSATSGWGLKCDQGSLPRCLHLVATDDMGAHWEEVEIKP